MAKPIKESRIPQLGITVNIPTQTKIPLGSNLVFAQRSIPRPHHQIAVTATSSTNNKFINPQQQLITTYTTTNQPKVFTSHSGDESTTSTTTATTAATATTCLSPHSTATNSPRRDLDTSNESNNSSSSSLNCTVISVKSQNANLSFGTPQKSTTISATKSSSSFNNNSPQITYVEQNSATTSPIDQKHVGQQVLVGGTEIGLLKFVGNVQFDTGIWCGVELSSPIGKHDGFVKGVRYFTCRKNHGILAPVSKIELLSPAADGKTNFEKLKSKFERYASKIKSPTIKFNRKHNIIQDKDHFTSKELPTTQQYLRDYSPECKSSSIQRNETIVLEDIGEKRESSSGPYSLIGIPSTSCAITSINDDVTIIKTTETPLSEETEQQNCEELFKSDPNLCSRRNTFVIESGDDLINLTTTFDTNSEVPKTLNETCILSPSHPTITNNENQNRDNTFRLDNLCATDINSETFIKNKLLNSQRKFDAHLTYSVRDFSLSPKPSSPDTSLNRTLVNDNSNNFECLSPIECASTSPLILTPPVVPPTTLENKKNVGVLFKNLHQSKKPLSVSPLTLEPNNLSKSRNILDTANLTAYNSTRSQQFHSKAFYESQFCVSNPNTQIPSSVSSNIEPQIQPIQTYSRPNLLIPSSTSTPHPPLIHFSKKSPIFSNPNTLHLTSQNSFELDESLGILTPDQMCEFPKTPSTDDLRAILSDFKPSGDNKTELKSCDLSDEQDFQKIQSQDPNSDLIEHGVDIDVNEVFIGTRSFKQSTDLSILSPNVPDSTGDLSLELLNDDILNGTTFLTDNSISNLDTTINMDLPLDPDFGKDENSKQVLRCEQTPSPEELPLDPVGVKLDIGEPVSNNVNTESDLKSKSNTKTCNSFVMSITSITSLDNGYQGDGEMSRPASRGGDHSPTVHKPSSNSCLAINNNQWQRPAAVSRRPDPMTDSDFFTESDADGHDENALKGDRKAQVIDGHLYGLNAVNPQQPAGEEIFVNNQNQIAEEMDSSGIFTDLDTNTRADEYSDVERNRNDEKVRGNNDEDQTPSDISSKTISENSQERYQETSNTIVPTITQVENVINNHGLVETIRSSIESKSSPTGSCQSSPSRKSVTTTSSPKFKKPKEETVPLKKYKMPRRNVVSKVKTMLESTKTQTNNNNIENQENRKPLVKKSGNKWDSVLSKITDNKITKPKLKDVKSKVACGLSGSGGGSLAETRTSNISKRSTILGENANNTNKSPNVSTKLKRRMRTPKTNQNGGQTSGSIHSSLSDISNSGSVSVRSLSKTASLQSLNRAAKKAASVTSTRCTSPPSSDTTRYQGVSPSGGSAHRIVRTQSGLVKKSPLSTRSSPLTNNNDAPSKRLVTPRRIGGGYNNNGPSVKNTTSTVPSTTATTASTSTVAKDSTRLTGAPIAKARCVVAVQTVPEVINVQPTAPDVEPQLQHAALSIEALVALLQHLIFHYEALKMPALKKDYEKLKRDWTKTRLDLDEARIGYRRLEELLKEEKSKNATYLDEERHHHLITIAELNEKHRQILNELNEKYTNEKQEIEKRSSAQINEQQLKYTMKITELNEENEKWKNDYENMKNKYEKAQEEIEKINNTYLIRENEYKMKLDKATEKMARMHDEFKQKETELLQKISSTESKISTLEEESKKVVDCFKAETKDGKVHAALNRCNQLQDETESLRTVLDLKQKECADLRKKYEEALRDAEQLPQSLLKVHTLQARVEDLEIQLARKTDYEKQLTQEKKLLMESFQQESEQKKRLTFQNEELQWKLKQNSEVVNVLLSGIHTPSKNTTHGSNQSLNDDSSILRLPHTPSLARSLQTSSFSEKHSFTTNASLDKNSSYRDKFISPKNGKCERKSSSDRKSDESQHSDTSQLSYFEIEDISPPSSPKIKAVVEKCDSVSYVIEIDESPEVLANRIYRRSFRNSTPPKNTPIKSPNLKRYKSKNHPLSLSASETSISSEKCDDDLRSRSKSMSTKKSSASEKGRSDDDEFDVDECYASCWTSPDSNNDVLDFRQDVVVRRVELDPTEITVDSDSIADELIIDSDNKNSISQFDVNDDYTDRSVHMSLPALPSELHRSLNDKKTILPTSGGGTSDMQHLLQSSFPKNSAGEAMISESNSEDECSSTSVSSDRSHSLSDVDQSDNLAKTAAEICKKTSQMQYDLLLMTESTISENIDCSWSEDI